MEHAELRRRSYRILSTLQAKFSKADSFRSSFPKTVHQTRINAAITELKLPAMSPTMTEGSIGEYKIKEGEAFSAGDVIMTVETDKGALRT